MRKCFCLLLTFLLAFTFSACGTGSPIPVQLSPTPVISAVTATQAATTQAVSTPSPTPRMDTNPELTEELYSIPKPQPAPEFKQADALAKKIMKAKKWAKMKYAGTVKDAIAIVLANSNAYTPEQLAAKFKKNVNSIVIADNVNAWGYNPINKTISLNAQTGNLEQLLDMLTDSISGFADYQAYPYGKIDGVTWCFGSSKTVRVGKSENQLLFMSGLQDFISSRNTPGAIVSHGGSGFNGIMVVLPYYNDGIRLIPFEQGFAKLFYYAAGSRDVEKAFFGDKKASDAYKAAFAERFGEGKLDALISAVDEVSMYAGYTSGMPADQQAEGLEKVKAYENMLLDLLETRLAEVKNQQDLDTLKSDFIQFADNNMSIDDASSMEKINTRVVAIWKAISAKVLP